MKKFESAEIYSSGICNLDCKYCYIPKVKELKEINDKIVEQIRNGSYIQKVKKICPDLENFSLWGAEPTVTLSIIGEQIPTIFSTFPKLKCFMFSTNLIKDPDIIFDFAKTFPSNRNVELKIQFSIDGYEEITDLNRGKGTTKKVIDNIRRLAFLLNDLENNNLKVNFQTKATWTMENIKFFLENMKRMDDSNRFFEKLTNDLNRINTNKNINYDISYWPNMEIPGKYTAEDGKLFSSFCESVFGKEKRWSQVPFTQYITSLKRAVELSDFLYSRNFYFTCSAGRSQLGVSIDGFHGCHRTYGFVLDKMKEYELCDFDFVYENNHLEEKDFESDYPRMVYNMSNFHDYARFKFNATIATIYELSQIGEILPKYKNYENAYSLALMEISNSCYVENFIANNNNYIPPISMMRLFGNGALDIFLEYLRCEKI